MVIEHCTLNVKLAYVTCFSVEYIIPLSSSTPTFTLFVNDPKLFGDTYRRYIERQLRDGMGFDGTPVKLFWRGKQQRDAQKDLDRQSKEQNA